MKANRKASNLTKEDDALIFELLIGAVFALIIGYAAMNIGVFINGTVADSLVATYPANHPANYTGLGEAATWRSPLQNDSVDILEDLSDDLSANTNMVSTAYLITIITLPLMAVIMIKKFI